MKKVKVLKEMPFANVGKVFELSGTGAWTIDRDTIHSIFDKYYVERMIKDGWLEWVEEPKSLVRKFRDFYDDRPGDYYEDIAQIAREHMLEVFDKVCPKSFIHEKNCQTCKDNIQVISNIRKALENA